MTSDDESIQQAVRRQTGVAALRRLRELVDQDAARERVNVRWARRLGVVFLVAAIAAIVWLAQRAPH